MIFGTIWRFLDKYWYKNDFSFFFGSFVFYMMFFLLFLKILFRYERMITRYKTMILDTKGFIFGPIIIQIVLRRTGAWLRRTGAWYLYFIKVYTGPLFFEFLPWGSRDWNFQSRIFSIRIETSSLLIFSIIWLNKVFFEKNQ